MALTRITKGVIKPNENYDTHNINSTGIVTAIGLDVNGDGDISGNLSVGGVLTYEDVTSIDSVGIITARKGVRVPDGDVNNNYISAGDSQDIKIYHDGSHSYIRDIGTGGLRITSNSFNVLNSANGEAMITGTEDGAVKLYYDHNLRLETSGTRTIFRGSGGIGVYGDSGSNQNGQISIHPTGSAVYTNLFFYNAAGNSYASIIGHAGGTLFFTGGTNSPLRHRVNGTGFHSFQEGNTQRVTITAGGTVNIGGDFTNTTGKLKVTGNSIFAGDIDVDGHTNLDNVSIAGVTTMSGNLTISNTDPRIIFVDTNNNPDFTLHANGGEMQVENSGSGTQVKLESSGSTRLFGNVIANKDLDVDGHTNLDNVSVAGVTTMTSSVTPILRIQKSSSDGSVLYAHRTGNTSGGGAELRVTDGYSATVPLYAFWYNNNTGIGNPAANTTSFIQNGSEKVRINSTGDIGINFNGTPAATLDIRTDRDPANGMMCFLRNNTQNGNGAFYGVDTNSVGAFSFGIPDNTNAFVIVDGLGNSGTERLRITSVGHLGLGMTPDTWHTNNQKVFQISGTNAGLNIFTRAGSHHLSSNFIYNSSDAGVFQAASGYAMHHAVSATNGTFDWLSSSAASSSAGSAATMVNRMRLDSSGRLLLGATTGGNGDTDDLIVSGSGKKGITVCSTNGSECRLTFADGLSGVNAVAGNITYTHSIDSLDLYTATTRRLRIDSSGRLLLGTTTEGYSSADDLTVSTSGTTGITIRSGTSNSGTLAFSDGTSGADEYRGYIQYEHQNDALAFGSNGTERLRITSTGNIQHTSASGVSYFTGSSEYIIGSQYSSPSAGGPEAKFQVHENKSRATVSINGYYNNAGAPILQFVSSRSNTKGVLGTKAINGDYIGDIRFFGDNGTNGSTLVQSAAIQTFQRSNISDGDTVAAGEIQFLTGTATGGSVTEKLKIGSSGQVDIGTSGVLKAVINNSVSGHQFISQCDDNNDGFEIYQQHGSTSSRNTLAVYNNSTGSKHLNFYVRGDNQVFISTNKDSVGLVMDGTSSGTAYGETGATIDFRQLNEVNQFTGNPAARIASYLERGNNGFGLKFYGRNSASSFAAMVQLSADYEWEPCSDLLSHLGSPDRSWNKAYIANAYPDQGTEYRITSGTYTNGAWHDTAFRRDNMGGLDLNGVYIVTAYSDLYNAMGGNYSCNYTWIVGMRNQYTNQTLVNTCPLLSVTGHSTNNYGHSGATVGDGIRLGTRREPAASGSQEVIVWRPAVSTSTINNTAGRTLVFRVQRIGRSSLG